MSGRRETHYVGDDCPGGHREDPASIRADIERLEARCCDEPEAARCCRREQRYAHLAETDAQAAGLRRERDGDPEELREERDPLDASLRREAEGIRPRWRTHNPYDWAGRIAETFDDALDEIEGRTGTAMEPSTIDVLAKLRAARGAFDHKDLCELCAPCEKRLSAGGQDNAASLDGTTFCRCFVMGQNAKLAAFRQDVEIGPILTARRQAPEAGIYAPPATGDKPLKGARP